MLEITWPRHGAVLNRHHGVEDAEALEIRVEGLASTVAPVYVNGVPARRDGRKFTAPVRLTEKFNRIEAATENEYGEFRQQQQVLWDRNSFPRYNFFIDDNVYFFAEIARTRPRSLFDQFYLKFLRDMHRRYGTKFTLNIFYRDDTHDFELRDFPDAYRQEWIDQADWLRLTFHAYAEFPDRPYQDAAAEKLGADYDLVKAEIIRFAGEATFIKQGVIHWAMATPDGLRALAQRGVDTICGGFSVNTGRQLRESYREARAGGECEVVDPLSRSGAEFNAVCDTGYFRNVDDVAYLIEHRACYDSGLRLLFAKSYDVCCNLLTSKQIRERLEARFRNPYGTEHFGVTTHEQYTYPDYPCYLPDHMERMETAIRCLAEHGCAPVWYGEGLLGNPAWETVAAPPAGSGEGRGEDKTF